MVTKSRLPRRWADSHLYMSPYKEAMETATEKIEHIMIVSQDNALENASIVRV